MTAFSLADLVTYLPCDLMTKVDIASMAHSLECRQPFLDYRLVELAASFPAAWKFRRGQGKRILRRAFGDLLPNEIWTRRKMGFGVPLDHWFRNELRPLTPRRSAERDGPLSRVLSARSGSADGGGPRARPVQSLLPAVDAVGVRAWLRQGAPRRGVPDSSLKCRGTGTARMWLSASFRGTAAGCRFVSQRTITRYRRASIRAVATETKP